MDISAEQLDELKEIAKNLETEDGKNPFEFEDNSPLHIANFDDKMPSIIAGYSLLINGDINQYIDENMKNNTRNGTILILDNRHMFEIMGLIYGVIGHYALKEKHMEREYFNKLIANYVYKCTFDTYSNYVSNMKEILYKIKMESAKGKTYTDMIMNILVNLIFIPYSKIDALAMNYIKSLKENENEEENGDKEST